MSMNINSVSNTDSQSNTDGNNVQRRQDMKDLFSAIKSGNLQDAQQAYAALTNGQTPPANSPLGKIGAALQTGDMATVDSTIKSLPGLYTYTVSKILDNKYNLTAFTSNAVSVKFLQATTSTTTTTVATSTTSSSQTSTSATSSESSVSMTSTSTSSTVTSSRGSGGIPELPYQLVAVICFTAVIVASYFIARRRR